MNLYDKIAEIFNSSEEDRDDILANFFRSEYNRRSIDKYSPEDHVWKAFHEKTDELGLIITLADHTGGEGQGEEYWSVYEFVSLGRTVYIKFDGYYQSYEGSTFEEFYEVKPKQKTITVYEQA